MADTNTGTRDATYDLISVAYHALQGAENCARYQKDAQGDVADFFKEAQQKQRELADRAKSLLSQKLS